GRLDLHALDLSHSLVCRPASPTTPTSVISSAITPAYQVTPARLVLGTPSFCPTLPSSRVQQQQQQQQQQPLPPGSPSPHPSDTAVAAAAPGASPSARASLLEADQAPPLTTSPHHHPGEAAASAVREVQQEGSGSAAVTQGLAGCGWGMCERGPGSVRGLGLAGCGSVRQPSPSPTELVMGLAALDSGLRHRRPADLKQQQQQLVGQRDMPPSDGGQPLFIRLLRSALGRLHNLTDLRLAGCDLTGLLEPLESTATHLPRPTAPQALPPTARPHLALPSLLHEATAADPPHPAPLPSAESQYGVLSAAPPAPALSPSSSPSPATSHSLAVAPGLSATQLLAATLTRCHTLDLGHTRGITLKQLAAVLTGASGLRHLHLRGSWLAGDSARVDALSMHIGMGQERGRGVEVEQRR
ncbi:hypothetical protein QJQ45_016210, partial [Haematococcus lacustris]